MNGAPIEEATQIRRRLTRAGSKAPLALGAEEGKELAKLLLAESKEHLDADTATAQILATMEAMGVPAEADTSGAVSADFVRGIVIQLVPETRALQGIEKEAGPRCWMAVK